MSKVITFSRYFPKGHLRSGEPTYFLEKIWCWKNKSFELSSKDTIDTISDVMGVILELDNLNNSRLPKQALHDFFSTIKPGKYYPKSHTIRQGKRWKVGDAFSPRVWIGKPYVSKQIIIAPDIEIVKVWDFEIINKLIILNGVEYTSMEQPITDNMRFLAKNDGLSVMDFREWFSSCFFQGQIICWNKNIQY